MPSRHPEKRRHAPLHLPSRQTNPAFPQDLSVTGQARDRVVATSYSTTLEKYGYHAMPQWMEPPQSITGAHKISAGPDSARVVTVLCRHLPYRHAPVRSDGRARPHQGCAACQWRAGTESLHRSTGARLGQCGLPDRTIQGQRTLRGVSTNGHAVKKSNFPKSPDHITREAA